jgi:hypothetical protein
MFLTEDDLDDISQRCVDLGIEAYDLEVFEIAGALWERRYGRRLTHTCRHSRHHECVSRHPFSIVNFTTRCGKCRADRAAMRAFRTRWFHG